MEILTDNIPSVNMDKLIEKEDEMQTSKSSFRLGSDQNQFLCLVVVQQMRRTN